MDSAVDAAALDAQYEHPIDNELGMIQFLMEHGAKPSKSALDKAEAIKDAKAKEKVLGLLNKQP